MRQRPDDESHLEVQRELEQIRRSFRILKRIGFTLIGIALIAGIGWAAIIAYHHFGNHKRLPPDPVPLAIRQSVNFDIYYPDPAKLPAGYHLDTRSFSSNNLAVVYRVNYGNGQKLVFSDQEKPSDGDIQQFYAKHMPLHINVSTSVGTAAIGIIGTKAVASLPTNSNSWLLVTAPSNFDSNVFARVLRTIQKAH